MPIAALVLGIVGLVLSFVPCLGMYAIPLTLIAVILGVLGMKPPKDGSPQKGKGMAVAGLVCGLIGTLIAAYWIYAYFSLKSKLNDPNFKGEFDKAFKEGMDKAAKDMEKDMKEMKETQPDHPAEDKPAQ